MYMCQIIFIYLLFRKYLICIKYICIVNILFLIKPLTSFRRIISAINKEYNILSGVKNTVIQNVKRSFT